jgi:hypothetical protein
MTAVFGTRWIACVVLKDRCRFCGQIADFGRENIVLPNAKFSRRSVYSAHGCSVQSCHRFQVNEYRTKNQKEPEVLLTHCPTPLPANQTILIGALSCAECRRQAIHLIALSTLLTILYSLKLKCDKTVPCSRSVPSFFHFKPSSNFFSCKRRGCSAICPNGSLITGQGTRYTSFLYSMFSYLS